MLRLLLTVALLAAGAVGVSSAAASRADVAPVQVSSNWAGYAISAPVGADPLTFGDVTGTWVVSPASCTLASSSSSAFWVGLGGLSSDSSSLQQLGTQTDCNLDGTASYSAWWEIVPASVVPVKLKINPGDTITAAVVVSGQRVTMSLKDVTRRTRFSKTITTAQPLDVSSAEWIAEAPSVCGAGNRCRVLPLTNFGTVTFAHAAAIGNTHPGTILDPLWQATPIQLSSRSHFGFGRFQPPPAALPFDAVPSTPTADGRGFTVTAQTAAG